MRRLLRAGPRRLRGALEEEEAGDGAEEVAEAGSARGPRALTAM